MPATEQILVVTPETFIELLQDKLGEQFLHAVKLFTYYGPRLSGHFTNACLFAADQGPEKVEEVLRILEQHWLKDLSYKHPEQKGTEHNPGVFIMFNALFQETLKLNLEAAPSA